MLAEVVWRRTTWTASRTVAAVANGRLAIVANLRLAPFAAILALLNVCFLDQIIQQLRPVFFKVRNGVVDMQRQLGRFRAVKGVALVVALNDSGAITPQVKQLLEHFIHFVSSLVSVGEVVVYDLNHDCIRLLPGGVAELF